jgi:transmembrane sensor
MSEMLRWTDVESLSSDEAAAMLVERLERDEPGVEEALVDRWLAASEANRLAWTHARDAWDALDGWEDEPALAAMRAGALGFGRRADRPNWQRYAVAAGVAAVMTTAVTLGIRTSGTRTGATGSVVASSNVPDALRRFGQPDFVAPPDQASETTLPDGTHVRLAPGSAIDVAYNDQGRLARLTRGEASFDVRHDAADPFRVAAGGRIVSDLGTLFAVRLAPEGVHVALTRGSVSIARGDDPAQAGFGKPIVLVPGQELVASANGPDKVGAAGQMEPEAPAMLSFDNQPLSAVVPQVNRGSVVQLSLADSRVAALRISGSFRAADAARFARNIAAIYPVKTIKAAGDSLILTMKR